MNPNEINEYPLFQSRNGGKIHHQGCGQRSMHISNLGGTKGMTFQQIVDKYGTDLCSYCFPGVAKQAKAPAAPAPAPGPAMCPGSYTHDWKGGEPTRTGYYTGNGGYCGHCGKWVTISSNQQVFNIRKHSIA